MKTDLNNITEFLLAIEELLRDVASKDAVINEKNEAVVLNDDIAQEKDDLMALKKSMELKLLSRDADGFNDALRKTSCQIDNLSLKIEKTNSLLETLVKKQTLLEEHSKVQTKLKRLELASERTEIGSFDFYYEALENGEHAEGECPGLVSSHWPNLASWILQNFMFDCGYDLPIRAYVGSEDDPRKEEGKVLFREKIVKQIAILIGHEPRLENYGEGQFAIYCS